MSQAIPILERTFTAGEAMTSSKGCAVYMYSANTVKLATTEVTPIGILMNAPASGELARVCLVGTAKVKADGAFSAGDILGVADANGELDTAAVHVPAIAIALEAASGAGSLVEALVVHFSTHA